MAKLFFAKAICAVDVYDEKHWANCSKKSELVRLIKSFSRLVNTLNASLTDVAIHT